MSNFFLPCYIFSGCESTWLMCIPNFHSSEKSGLHRPMQITFRVHIINTNILQSTKSQHLLNNDTCCQHSEDL